MKTHILLAIALLFTSVTQVFAQQVVKRDTLNGTPLTVSMDRSISQIMENMEERCATVGITRNENTVSTPAKPTTVKVPSRQLTTAEICRQTPRIMGVKIQVAVVKSNDEANEVKAYFRRRFPSLKVETDASLRPNYKILAGSYFSRQSAKGDLTRIRQFFQSAVAVDYRVFCVEAK